MLVGYSNFREAVSTGIRPVKQELQHAEDITKYTTMIQSNLEQIDQVTNIINQDIEQLRRFGNPDTYVHMLGPNELFRRTYQIK